MARTIRVTGTLAADDQAVLSLKVSGRLSEIDVDLGSAVRKGDVVARLDATDYQLRVTQAETAVQQARARLGLALEGDDDSVDPERTAIVRQAIATRDEARLTRDRMASLSQQKLVPQSEWDAAEAALGVAAGKYQDALEEVRNRQAILAQRRAELKIARQQLADTVLYAPFDGAARARQTAIGEFLAAGAPVVTIVRMHPLRLRLPVPEREAHGVRIGQPVRLAVEGDPASHEGRVARLSPALSEQNRTLLVEAEVPNEKGLVRPGSFAQAEILVESGETVILVPASAIVTFAGIEKVISVADGRAVEKRVRTGRREEGRVEILEGLAAGEPVVADPGNLAGGQAVTVVP